MFKSRLSAGVAAAVLALCAAGSAQALTITAGGYIIQLANYDAGTLYASGNPLVAGTTTVCSDVASCNTAAVQASAGSGSSGFDTQGILRVTSITTTTSPQVDVYQLGQTSVVNGITFGPYLTGVFGGLSDYQVTVSCTGSLPPPFTPVCQTQALASGGVFSLYNNANNWDPTLGPTGAGVNLNSGTYAGISGGQLLLGGNFVAGGAYAGSNASYQTSYNSNTIDGAGSGYLEFTSGTALALFHNNAQQTVNPGVMADAFLSTTFNANFDPVNNPSNGWLVQSSSNVSGQNNNLPEPGSLALVSLALLGLGAAAVRRNKSV